MRSLRFATLLLLGLAVAGPALAQDKPADNMQVLLEKIRADKKLLVAENMNLTEAEAKGFWPVYDELQAELASLNQRTGQLIRQYAETGGNVTPAAANAILDEFLSVEKGRLAMYEKFRPRFAGVLPAPKVVRYYQIENKIRAVIQYGLAAEIPLVP